MDDLTSTERTISAEQLAVLKGKAVMDLAINFAGREHIQAISYLTNNTLFVLISKLIPGKVLADFITCDAQLRGADKFYTKWTNQDLDTLVEILRVAFVAGIFHERKTASNRSRPNNRNSNKARNRIQNNGGTSA